jgi:excisionase family DNA binding protein
MNNKNKPSIRTALLTTKEAAKYLNVTEYTLRVLARSGKIKEINLGYRTKRYDISDLITDK